MKITKFIDSMKLLNEIYNIPLYIIRKYINNNLELPDKYKVKNYKFKYKMKKLVKWLKINEVFKIWKEE